MTEIDSRPHWNERIPGKWSLSRSVSGAGGYISKYVQPTGGVYRLVAMADFETGTPMIINRVCGQDQTGTLYIGLARRSVRFRLQQLMRSLREPRQFGSNKEHDAGRVIRRNPLLKEKFPQECLAVRWAYDNNPQFLEGNLLAHYFECFGEIPPLNAKRGYEQWIDD